MSELSLSATEAREREARLKPMLERARAIYAKIEVGTRGMLRRRDALCWRSWQLGKELAAIKEEVGHGRWLHWLGGHWPDMSPRNASRCMLLYSANPNGQNFADLSTDSIRQFMFEYVPSKERPTIEGDEKLSPKPTGVGFVNGFMKWDERCTNGLATRPPVEVLRTDFEPVVRRIAELAGPDWIRELLAG